MPSVKSMLCAPGRRAPGVPPVKSMLCAGPEREDRLKAIKKSSDKKDGGGGGGSIARK